jgi:hypothetical protein
MMKKRFSITLLLFLFCVAMTPLFSFAQEDQMNGNEMLIASPSPEMSITPSPDYPIPYPGLLPDSPLYPLKTLRDRLISILIGDPLKKADFDLLQSDKRIAAAVVLLENGNAQKQDLAVSTVSKGLNYYDESFQKTAEAKKQGDGIADIKDRLKRASHMYRYMLQKAEKKTNKSIDAQVDMQISRLSQLTKLVESL